MAQKINQKQFVNIVKEAITKTLKESGFNGYDMQPQTPMTKQQQIDASWQEFNDNNKNRLAQQQQDANVGSYLDSNINADDLKGQLGMDAMSNDKDVANIAQMTKGTPRQTGQRYDNYLKQKYTESKKQKFNMTESQLNSLIKECITEVLTERKHLKEDADGGWFARLQKMYNELSTHLKKTNQKAYQYLIMHQDDDGVIEDMYSMLKQGLI